MFNGLGLNEELLFLLKELDIKYIEVPFCGETLKTTTNTLGYGVTAMLIHEVLRAQDLDSSVASLIRNDIGRFEKSIKQGVG